MRRTQFNETTNNTATNSVSISTLNYVNDPDRISGLFISGKVMDRSRRLIPRDDPRTEVVTYLVQDGYGRKYYLDHFEPEGYFNIGEQVCVPVYIKPYTRKSGELGYTIYIQKPSSQTVRGEHF